MKIIPQDAVYNLTTVRACGMISIQIQYSTYEYAI